MRFLNHNHRDMFYAICRKFEVDMEVRDYVLLMFLLSAIADESTVDDLVTYVGGGSLRIRKDGLSCDWVTGGDARIIRLAYHLFTHSAPTAETGKRINVQELRNYFPLELLDGLDWDLKHVALEALRLWCFWGDLDGE